MNIIMKIPVIIIACASLLVSCDCKNGTDGKASNCSTGQQDHNGKRGCSQLTTNEFRTRIADISKPEWRFLGDKPAVIDFYADWCGPCRMIAPTVEKVAQKYDGKIDVYKVNIDNEPELAQAFGISSIPTILFVPMRGEPMKEIGIMTMAGFERNIGKLLE